MSTITSNRVLPSGWSHRNLGDLVTLSNESGIPNANQAMPFVGMEHIEAQSGHLLAYGNPSDYKSSSNIVDSNQILYGRLRPYLNKVFIPKERCFASREFIPMLMNGEVQQLFLLHLLRSSDFVEFAVSLNAGDRPRVKWPQMAQFPIALPPLEEQAKIVEILEEQLSRLDAALASVRAVREKSARFRRSLLHAAFTGALTGHDTSMRTIPKSWLVKPLSELCEQGRDSIVDGPFGSNLKRSDFLESGIPVLKLQNIKPNSIIQKNMDFVSLEKYEEIKRHSFRLGDIVMTKLGDPLGVSAIVTDIESGVIVADLVRVRPKNVNTKFLCYQLNSPLIAKHLNDNQKGTTRPRINLAIVRGLKLNIPPLDEQVKIVEILEEQLSRLDASLAVANAIEKKASALRRSLLHAAFTGELTREWREGTHV